MSGVSKRKKTVILQGNCQCNVMAGYLLRNPDIGKHCDVFSVTPITPQKDVVTPELVAGCDCLVQQIELYRKNVVIPDDAFPAKCERITFPCFSFPPFWPLYLADPRDALTPVYPSGKYPYGDNQIIRMLNSGLSPDEIFRRYMELDLHTVIDLDVVLDRTVREMESLDQRTDCSMKDFIMERYRNQKLFLNIGHVYDYLLLYMLEKIVAIVADKLDVSVPQLPAPVGARQGRHEVPIHPAIIDHYKLEFVSKDSVYHYQDSRFTFEDYIRSYIAFEDCAVVFKEQRELKFPDHSVGSVMIRPAGSMKWEWTEVGTAQGNVIVPSAHEVMLHILGHPADYSFLESFGEFDLKVLCIDDAEFGDDCAKYLKNLKSVSFLDLKNTSIGRGSVTVLCSLHGLTSIRFPDETSEETILEIHRALPDCGLVHFDRLFF